MSSSPSVKITHAVPEEELVQVTLSTPGRDQSAVTLAWSQTSAITHHLHFGGLYAGSVFCLVLPGWREKYQFKEDSPQYRHNIHHEAKPWRAWFMSDEDGDAVGYFETLDEAKNFLAAYTIDQVTADHGSETPGGSLEPTL